MNDVHFAVRQLRKSPGFTIVAALTLGLGIGACAAIFSVVNGVLLRPLPFPEPERLVALRESFLPTVPDSSVAYAKYGDWQRQASSFESIGALDGMSYNLGGPQPVHLYAGQISASLLATLGIAPTLGRNFVADDEVPRGGGGAAMFSWGLWQRRFGGRPEIVGQTVELNGRPYRVVGVMAQDSGLPERMEVFTPLTLPRSGLPYNWYSLQVFGRLRPGVTVAQAEREMAVISGRMAREHPETEGWAVRVVPLTDLVVGPMRPALVALLGAVGFLLLIACANVANLLLARASSRTTEMAVRAAVGAGRGRIFRLLLVESLILALLGGVLGLVIARGGLAVLLALAPDTLPRAAQIAVDGRALAFTLGLALLTGVGFGLVPAFQGSRVQLQGALKQGGRAFTDGARRQRLRGALVVTEVAVALWLLAGAGLLMRSFARLQDVDPGFNPDHAHVASIYLPRPAYLRPAQHIAFAEQAMTEIRALPGVRAVGVSANIPFSNMHQTDMSASMRGFVIPGRPPLARTDTPMSSWYTVTPDFFRAMEIPVLRGRAFDARDLADGPKVAIISESLGRRFFPGEDPLGKAINIGGPVSSEIVGIVADIKSRTLDGESTLQTYQPFTQSPDNDMVFVVRTDGPLSGVPAAIHQAIARVDPSIPVYDARPLTALVGASIARQRFAMTLFAVFSAVALLLAAIGIYGVMAFSVGQRTGEIGLRMALGAQTGDVLRLVLAQGGLLCAAGIVAGLAGAVLLAGMLEGLLFSTSTHDPLTFAAIATLLATVASVACLLPARRAARLDPMRALRAS